MFSTGLIISSSTRRGTARYATTLRSNPSKFKEEVGPAGRSCSSAPASQLIARGGCRLVSQPCAMVAHALPVVRAGDWQPRLATAGADELAAAAAVVPPPQHGPLVTALAAVVDSSVILPGHVVLLPLALAPPSRSLAPAWVKQVRVGQLGGELIHEHAVWEHGGEEWVRRRDH
eukprot:840643-Pleurochrysis_carterae.AAC.1